MIACSGGTELPSLLPSVESVIGQYYSWMLSVIKSIRATTVGESSKEQKNAEMSQILELLQCSCKLQDRIQTLHKKIQDELVAVGPKLREAASLEELNLTDMAVRRYVPIKLSIVNHIPHCQFSTTNWMGKFYQSTLWVGYGCL